VKRAAFIVIDEAPAMNKNKYDCMDVTFRDIMKDTHPDAKNKLFGGKVVLMSGDFRQVLPVVPRGGREAQVAASLKRWSHWRHVTKMYLRTNMRVANLANNPIAAAQADRYICSHTHPTQIVHIRIQLKFAMVTAI
jgi:PIF1-like helicase